MTVTDDVIRTERSALDVLQGRLPLWLGGQRYVLPVLTTGMNREWQATLDASLDPLIENERPLAEVLSALESIDLLGLVYSYDVAGVLPPRAEIEDGIYPHELLKAVFEVRQATNPTVAFAVATTTEEILSKLTTAEPPPSKPTSSSRRRTGGPTGRSATN